MSHKYVLTLLIVAFIIAAGSAFLLSQGNFTNVADNNSGKIKIAATIFPLADIARNIGGENIDIELIIPPGASEHTTSLTPQQLSRLQNTKVIFQIGHGLDDRLTARIISDLPGTQLATVDKNIDLYGFNAHAHEEHEEVTTEEEDEHDHDSGLDPHYWLIIPNAITIAENIAEQLQKIDPDHAAAYQANLKTYRQQLQNLEKDLQKQAASAPQKKFIAMHNAWSYFADHYGFELAATYEPREGKEPSVADIQHLQEVIQANNIKVFYTEPQKQKSAALRFLAEDFGLTIKILDPVGGVESRDSYINLMKFNMNSLTEPL